ncbi:MAG: Lrp/AsnC family transcriptional regulator, partial [Candidatus Micrarchaeota archaeon]|nr:Lrp/AsnC family transcriptional regulator [Candidatus Micrarchaeota archaeon]
DLNMWYWATSVYDFEDFWKAFLSKYRKYIARSWIHIATKLHHYRRRYLLPEADASAKSTPAVEVMGGGREKAEVDDLDMKILKILVVNARMPLIEIAEKVGASPKVVAYRIQNLIEKRVILFFRVVLDLEKAGYLYYKLHLYLRNMDDEKFGSLMEYCRQQPNVMYVDEKIGGADFELELHVESPEKFREIVADMRSRFSNLIADHESLLYYKEHKLAYLPTG